MKKLVAPDKYKNNFIKKTLETIRNNGYNIPHNRQKFPVDCIQSLKYYLARN